MVHFSGKGNHKVHRLVVEIKNMRDKKNFAIRVNYSKSGRNSENRLSEPEMITEWHVKRILLAVSLVGVLISGALYLFIKPDAPLPDAGVNTAFKPEIKNEYIKGQPVIIKPADKPEAVNKLTEPETQKQVASIKVKEVEKKQPVITKQKNVAKKQSATIFNKNVSRALLTSKINNKEPSGELNLPVRVNKTQALGIYYFTELTGLKGHTLYHEWLINGNVVFKHRLNILANRWRTSSSKLFTDNDAGNWAVRLIDEYGHILNKKSFRVVPVN